MPLYRAHGFREVYLGDEAIIPCETFSLSGSALKSVRSAVTRVGKNHSFRLMRETDASPHLCEELNPIRARWRGKAPERGFTMELGGGVTATTRIFSWPSPTTPRSARSASFASRRASATIPAGRSTSCSGTPTRQTA